MRFQNSGATQVAPESSIWSVSSYKTRTTQMETAHLKEHSEHSKLYRILHVRRLPCLEDLLYGFILILWLFDPAAVTQQRAAFGCRNNTSKARLKSV